MDKRINTGFVIARMLGCQGFDHATANAIRRYMRRIATERDRGRQARIRKGMKEACIGLTEMQKSAIGRFIALQQKLALQTGLRIGLSALATENAHEEEDLTKETQLPHNREYQVEFLDSCLGDATEWMPLETGIADRARAKEVAVLYAKKARTETRVRQFGGTIQRYSNRGTKLGRD